MATKRVITSAIFEDEFFGTLNMMQRLLWVGLFTRCADDQGRLMDNPVVIRSQVFPYDDIPAKDIDAALQVFAGEGKIIRYKDERGRGYIQIVKWWENQAPQWATRSKFPAPDGWKDRVRTTIKGQYIAENWPEKSSKTGKQDQPPAPEDPPDEPGQPVPPPGHSSLSDSPDGHILVPVHIPDSVPDSGSEEGGGFDRPAEPPASQVYQNQEAVRIYREVFQVNPNQLQAKKIVAFATDPALWRSTCEHWREHDWRAANLPGLQDLYRKGGAKGCKQCASRDGPRSNGKPHRAEKPAPPPYTGGVHPGTAAAQALEFLKGQSQ